MTQVNLQFKYLERLDVYVELLNGEVERAWRAEDFKYYLRLGADLVTKIEHEKLTGGAIEGLIVEIEMREAGAKIIKEMENGKKQS